MSFAKVPANLVLFDIPKFLSSLSFWYSKVERERAGALPKFLGSISSLVFQNSTYLCPLWYSRVSAVLKWLLCYYKILQTPIIVIWKCVYLPCLVSVFFGSLPFPPRHKKSEAPKSDNGQALRHQLVQDIVKT